ncbi:MAG: NfeD family protein [Planctomycetota bacterium]
MSDPLLWGLALVALGFVLIAIEVFVPSGGLIAIGSAIAAIAGVVLLWIADIRFGVTGMLAVMILGPALFFFLMNILPSTPAGRALLGEEDDQANEARELATRDRFDEMRSLIGLEGVALSDLRRIGTVQVEGSRFDAMAEVDQIDAGERVVVTAAEMNQLRVRRAT